MSDEAILKRWASGFVTSVAVSKDGWLQLVSTNQRGTRSVRMRLDEDEAKALADFLAARPTSRKDDRK